MCVAWREWFRVVWLSLQLNRVMPVLFLILLQLLQRDRAKRVARGTQVGCANRTALTAAVMMMMMMMMRVVSRGMCVTGMRD
jgi:hypothetical protein